MCGSELHALPEGVQRVSRFLQDAGHPHAPQMLDGAARTAQEAADQLSILVGQVAKSIIFKRRSDGAAVLVVTSGDRRVDETKVTQLVGKVGRADADFVIVDLEGTATDRIGFAVSRSDLVLIPLQSSVLDAAEAAKSVKLVRQMWRVVNREIPYRVFFTRVPPAIRERTARDIDRQFAGAEIPVLPATLIDRAAFRTLFSLGGTLHELETSDVSGLDSAKENAREYAQAVINATKGGAA